MKQGGRKRRVFLLWGVVLLLAALVLPYLVPLSAPAHAPESLPFADSAFVEAAGTRIHYRLAVPEGPAPLGKLLLVHGLAGSTFSFEALTPLLVQAGVVVVSVDLPGFGYSSRDLNYDHSQANRAHTLWQLLDHVDQGFAPDLAAQPWHLAGHSMGGGTAYAMALQQPDRACGLVLMDAPLTGGSRSGLLSVPPLLQWTLLALEHLVLNEQRIGALLESAYGQKPNEQQVAGYLAPLRVPGTAQSLGRMVRTAREEDLAGFPDLPLPLLAIWGEEDRWVPQSALKALQALRPDMTALVVKGAGHCPMETHPQEVAEALLAWMKGN
jgi:pimeloyl-ACP methyl ester carboxylesterase